MKAPKDRAGSNWLRYSHLGIQYCVTLLLFVLAGAWADRKLDSGPWLTIAGSLIGMAAATYLLIREVQRIRS